MAERFPENIALNLIYQDAEVLALARLLASEERAPCPAHRAYLVCVAGYIC